MVFVMIGHHRRGKSACQHLCHRAHISTTTMWCVMCANKEQRIGPPCERQILCLIQSEITHLWNTHCANSLRCVRTAIAAAADNTITTAGASSSCGVNRRRNGKPEFLTIVCVCVCEWQKSQTHAQKTIIKNHGRANANGRHDINNIIIIGHVITN